MWSKFTQSLKNSSHAFDTRPPVQEREWSEGDEKETFRIAGIVFISIINLTVVLSLVGTIAVATSLVDDTVEAGNLYSQYSLNNYQLDFFVDSSWDWLPWNWGDGLGKSVMYGLYAITNFIWTVSLYLSNATGYVVQKPINWISFRIQLKVLGRISNLSRHYRKWITDLGLLL